MQGPRTTIIYLAVVFGLLVIPRALQRFRLPAALTCFAFGIIVAGFFKPLATDSVISYVSTLGIASLFLFAGLEVDLVELRRELPSLAGHFALRGLVLVVCARLAAVYLHLGWQVDWLLALALLTPSTGFILDMLPHSGLDHVEQSEVALHAVAGEVTAVFLFLVISQADSVKTLLISGGCDRPVDCVHAPGFSCPGTLCGALRAGVGVLPAADGWAHLRSYHRDTRRLLPGGRIRCRAGRPVAQQTNDYACFRAESGSNPALRIFFCPLLFFSQRTWSAERRAGCQLSVVWFCASGLHHTRAHRRGLAAIAPHEARGHRGSLRVSIALTPTLIFTLVIAEMLRENFAISPPLYGGLLVYAAIASILPSLVLPALSATPVNPIAVEA